MWDIVYIYILYDYIYIYVSLDSSGGDSLSEKLAAMTREFNKWCQAKKIRPGIGPNMYIYIYILIANYNQD